MSPAPRETSRAFQRQMRSTRWPIGIFSAQGMPTQKPSEARKEAVATCVRVRETIEPNPAWVERYADRYARFRALYPAIRGVEEEHDA